MLINSVVELGHFCSQSTLSIQDSDESVALFTDSGTVDETAGKR